MPSVRAVRPSRRATRRVSRALGEQSYTAVQLASILGEAGLKLVPDVVLGEGRSNLADVLLAQMATGRAARDAGRDRCAAGRCADGNGHAKG